MTRFTSTTHYIAAAITTVGLAHPLFAQTFTKSADSSSARGATAALPAGESVVQPLRTDYRLEPGDKLRIEVYRDAQLSQSVQVRPDGKITMPLLGDIDANGSTPIELRDRVAAALKEYLNNPVVSVVVVEASQPTAYVVGGVNHPGAIVLKGNMTVLQALALAGGLKDFADAKNIRILRSDRAGAAPPVFNYRDAIKGLSGPVYLRPGDTVVVPD